MERTHNLSEQQTKDHESIRLDLINTAITEYAEKKCISISDIKNQLKRVREPWAQAFYDKDVLIIRVEDAFSHNGISFQIKYQIHELIQDLSI